jgi:hypothetical protein
MRRLRRAKTLVAALAAAAVAALALTLVPGAQATKAPPKAPPAPADVLLYRGATTVALDPGTAGALTSLGVSVAPTGSAYASKAGISFPITLGVVDGADLTGQIRHSGGLVFAKGATKVYLSRFFIDIDASPSLSGLVGAAPGTGARAELFALDLSGLKVEAGWHRIKLSGVKLTLTAGAAAALNQAFLTDAFTEGLPIGTATVKARTWTVPAS